MNSVFTISIAIQIIVIRLGKMFFKPTVSVAEQVPEPH